MKFEIPKPVKIEHDELHADLIKTTRAGGLTSDAAKAVAKVLHNHFIKEEEYALPPLIKAPMHRSKQCVAFTWQLIRRARKSRSTCAECPS